MTNAYVDNSQSQNTFQCDVYFGFKIRKMFIFFCLFVVVCFSPIHGFYLIFNVIHKAQINVFAMPFTEFEFTFSFWCCRCFVFEFSFIWYCCFVVAKMESKTFARNHHSFVRMFRFPWFCILISLPNLNFIRWYISSLLLYSLFVVYRLTIFEPMQLYEFSWQRTFIIVANRILTETNVY